MFVVLISNFANEFLHPLTKEGRSGRIFGLGNLEKAKSRETDFSLDSKEKQSSWKRISKQQINSDVPIF
jgi:hypothetical protein